MMSHVIDIADNLLLQQHGKITEHVKSLRGYILNETLNRFYYLFDQKYPMKHNVL